MSADYFFPFPLDCTNLAKGWPKWKRYFEMFMLGTDRMNKPEEEKISAFWMYVGAEGRKIYDSLFPNDGTTDSTLGAQLSRTLETVLKKFDEHCKSQKNVAIETLKFNTISLKENQPFHEFVKELRAQIRYCDFNCTCGASYDKRMLRDRIISGVHDKKLQSILLDDKNQQLNKVIEKLFEAPADKNQMKSEPMASSKKGPAKRKMADHSTPNSFKQEKRCKDTSETEITGKTENRKSAQYLLISGIPNKFTKSEDDQRQVFQKLCNKFEFSLSNEDIDKVYKNGAKLIVKFNQIETRNRFIDSAKETAIWTNDVCELNDNEKPKRIVIYKYIVPGLKSHDD